MLCGDYLEDPKKGVCFVGFTIFTLLYIICKPNEIIEIDFNLMLFLCLIVYLTIFKYLYLIKNAFMLRRDERRTVVIGTLLWFTFFIVLIATKTGNFTPISNISSNISIEILFQTFVEELIFRVVLLGILIEGIPLSKIKPFPFYFTKHQKNMFIIIMATLATSILFSYLHSDWINLKINLFWRSFQALFFYSIPFIVTNKKIYAPWLIHYINNLYVYG